MRSPRRIPARKPVHVDRRAGRNLVRPRIDPAVAAGVEYRKLKIRSRSQLPEALAEPARAS
jgi:hypothetical protein